MEATIPGTAKTLDDAAAVTVSLLEPIRPSIGPRTQNPNAPGLDAAHPDAENGDITDVVTVNTPASQVANAAPPSTHPGVPSAAEHLGLHPDAGHEPSALLAGPQCAQTPHLPAGDTHTATAF